eukprot:scaffold123596_cov22-Tisochrysis_lutea.AAC.1
MEPLIQQSSSISRILGAVFSQRPSRPLTCRSAHSARAIVPAAAAEDALASAEATLTQLESITEFSKQRLDELEALGRGGYEAAKFAPLYETARGTRKYRLPINLRPMAHRLRYGPPPLVPHGGGR